MHLIPGPEIGNRLRIIGSAGITEPVVLLLDFMALQPARETKGHRISPLSACSFIDHVGTGSGESTAAGL